MKQLLGYLMFLANNEGEKETWYPLKDKLIKTFGRHDGTDVQFINGKKCHACNGTGWYKKYYHNKWHRESCYRCTSGWYKLPMHTLLARVKIGNHIFHYPLTKAYAISSLAPGYDISPTVTINGYIEHKKQKYGWLAFCILYMIFDMKGYIRLVKGMGYGWRCSWWLPKNYLYNLVHLIRKRQHAIPIANFKFRKRLWEKINSQPCASVDDDLPF